MPADAAIASHGNCLRPIDLHCYNSTAEPAVPRVSGVARRAGSQ